MNGSDQSSRTMLLFAKKMDKKDDLGAASRPRRSQSEREDIYVSAITFIVVPKM